MHDPVPFMARPEFSGNSFGTVLFQLPSHRHGLVAGIPTFFGGDPTESDIQVRVMHPSKVGRRPAPGYDDKEGKNKRVIYSFEVRSQGGQNDADPAVLEGVGCQCGARADARGHPLLG